jgi:hypothetical protein
MVGQIGPLVQVGRKKTALAFHVLGGLVGGALLGVFLGFLGVVLAELFDNGLSIAFAIVIPVALAYAGLTDLGYLRLTYFSRIRQTPGSWPCALGHYPAMFAWGFDLGLGVTTRFAHQAVLVVPLAAVLTGSMWAAVAITAAYGGARALAVVISISRAGNEDFAAVCDRIQEHTYGYKRLVGLAALVTAFVIVIF